MLPICHQSREHSGPTVAKRSRFPSSFSTRAHDGGTRFSTRAPLELLAEHEQLGLIVDGQNTSSCNPAQNVGAGPLEQRPDSLLSNDLSASVDRGLVLDGLGIG